MLSTVIKASAFVESEGGGPPSSSCPVPSRLGLADDSQGVQELLAFLFAPTPRRRASADPSRACLLLRMPSPPSLGYLRQQQQQQQRAGFVATGREASFSNAKALVIFNAFNYWSVAFEPHSECGESERGSGDECEASSVVVAAAAGLTLPVKSATVEGAVGMQQQQFTGGSGGKRLVLNYYFGQDHTDGAAPSAATQAATAAACLAASESLGGASAGLRDVLFDAQGSSSSSSGSSSSSSSSSSISSSSCSSSSSSSSSSQLFLEPSVSQGQLFPHLEEAGLLSSPQQPDGLRRSASAGAELASLDTESREESCADRQQKQQPQRPVTATAPGMLLLPSVVSLSSFKGLGSLAFRRGAVAAGAASVAFIDAAPTAASAPAATSTSAAASMHDDQIGTSASPVPLPSGAEAVGVEGSSGGSEGRTSMSSTPAASPSHLSLLQSSETSSSAMPSAASAAVVSVESFHRAAGGKIAEAASDREASRTPRPQLSSEHAAAAGDSPAVQRPGIVSAPTASAAGISQGAGRLGSERGFPSGSPCTAAFAVTAAAHVNPGEHDATGADAVESATAPVAFGMGQSLTVQPSSSNTESANAFSSVPVSAGSRMRLWLPRSAREMRACSSTSAMFMALAQESPRLIQPIRGSPQLDAARLAVAGDPAAAERPGDSPCRSAASRARRSFGGNPEAIGSYTSFESTDPMTSRCDSFASAASCSRVEEETHAQGSAQQQLQQQQHDSLQPQLQQQKSPQQQLQQHNDECAAAETSPNAHTKR
ncbi:hypothetical protein Emed_002184 [Eimeria media]